MVGTQHAANRPPLLESLINSACSFNRLEPDIGLALEICEVVNQKTSYASRASNLLTKFLTGEDAAQCALALFVLDLLVINCGYPMHLAISKRDFLNKLAYRFPKSPQYQTDQTHDFILRLIRKWVIALCEKSPYRNDFGNIRLMYSLLKSKGFHFPEISESEINAIINVEDGIKTPEELLDEERRVQEAKLEDLLRRGTQADLRAANELMKTDGGYSKSETEVSNKLRELNIKKDLLEEILLNNGDQDDNSRIDSVAQLSSELRQALPKLEKLTESAVSEALLDNILNTTSGINTLLDSMETDKPPKLQQNGDDSLINLNEEESCDQEIFKAHQPIFLAENGIHADEKVSPLFTSFISPKAILHLHPVSHDKTILVLLNLNDDDLLNCDLEVGDTKIKFPHIAPNTASSEILNFSLEGCSVNRVSLSYTMISGKIITLTLIKYNQN